MYKFQETVDIYLLYEAELPVKMYSSSASLAISSSGRYTRRLGFAPAMSSIDTMM